MVTLTLNWEISHGKSFLFTKEFTLDIWGRRVGYMAMCVTNNVILSLQPGFAEGGLGAREIYKGKLYTRRASLSGSAHFIGCVVDGLGVY